MIQLEIYKEKTTELLQLLENPIKLDDRNDVVNKVDQLLNEREVVISEIKPPYDEATIQLGKEVVQLDEQLKPKLDVLLLKIKSDMKNNKKQTRSTKQYLNPYQKLANYDGMFMDSKK